MDQAELRAAIEAGTPFARTLGPVLVSVGDGEAVLRLDAPAALHNHVGGPHAATLFGLGETAAFGALLAVFPDLVEAGAVPLIKGAQVSYLAIATGVVTATARFGGQEDGVRESYARRGVAVFPVEVAMSVGDVEVCSMTAQMALKRF